MGSEVKPKEAMLKKTHYFIYCVFTQHRDFYCISESSLIFLCPRTQLLLTVRVVYLKMLLGSLQTTYTPMHLRKKPTITFNAIKLMTKIKICTTSKY